MRKQPRLVIPGQALVLPRRITVASVYIPCCFVSDSLTFCVSSQETSTNHYSDTLIMVSKSKAAYWNWVAYRDGSSWAESLFRTYQEAQRDGTTEKFMNNLLIQLAEGKGIMARLHDTIIQPLPRADWEIRDLWRQTFELLILIQDGISAIEMAITYHRVLGLGV